MQDYTARIVKDNHDLGAIVDQLLQPDVSEEGQLELEEGRQALVKRLGMVNQSQKCHNELLARSYAAEAGVPLDLIKMHGNWSSESYLLYVRIPLSMKLKAPQLVAEAVSLSFYGSFGL
jgi:hypothetical protein